MKTTNRISRFYDDQEEAIAYGRGMQDCEALMRHEADEAFWDGVTVAMAFGAGMAVWVSIIWGLSRLF